MAISGSGGGVGMQLLDPCSRRHGDLEVAEAASPEGVVRRVVPSEMRRRCEAIPRTLLRPAWLGRRRELLRVPIRRVEGPPLTAVLVCGGRDSRRMVLRLLTEGGGIGVGIRAGKGRRSSLRLVRIDARAVPVAHRRFVARPIRDGAVLPRLLGTVASLASDAGKLRRVAANEQARRMAKGDPARRRRSPFTRPSPIRESSTRERRSVDRKEEMRRIGLLT